MAFTKKRVEGYVKPTIVCGPGMTKQSQQDECDINNIIKKFDRTGVLGHMAAHEPVYMDVQPLDYQTALNTLTAANNAFEALPSEIRNRFRNDPAEFLAFVQDEANIDEMRQLGLAEPERPSEVPQVAEVQATDDISEA